MEMTPLHPWDHYCDQKIRRRFFSLLFHLVFFVFFNLVFRLFSYQFFLLRTETTTLELPDFLSTIQIVLLIIASTQFITTLYLYIVALGRQAQKKMLTYQLGRRYDERTRHLLFWLWLDLFCLYVIHVL